MKKILVLTDFTNNAFHAEAIALQVAEKLTAGIILYHTLPSIPLLPSDNHGPYGSDTNVLFEDSRERLVQEADRLREVAVMTPDCQVEIEESNGEGSLRDVIGELTQAPDIEIVIMGGRAGGALDHLLSGSDTAAVIRKSSKPVLIIPIAATQNIFKKIVFATDFAVADLPALRFLLNLAKLVCCQLEVVHIVLLDEVVTEKGPEVTFRKFLSDHGIPFKQVSDKDISNGLQAYCRKHDATLLAMTHRRHSLISRLFGHSISLTTITHFQLPVMVFPPGFENHRKF